MSCIKRLAVVSILLLLTIQARSQDIPSYRWEPGISIGNQLKEKWHTTLQLKGRGSANSYNQPPWNGRLLMSEARGYLSYTLFNQSRLQIGFLIRLNNPLEENDFFERRLMQQYSFFNIVGKHRISHSFTLEQRMIDKQFIGRVRYKLGDDFPLQGYALDPKEFFFVANTQLLFSFNAFSKGLENRITAGLGRQFESGGKLVVDLESRYGNFLNDTKSHILQLNTILYINW